MQFKKIFIITAFIITPLILTGCSLPFGPSNNKGRASGPKGIFKSIDHGDNWHEQNFIIDFEKTLAGYDNHQIAFDVFDNNIIYRGTNVGLFMSQDAGDSWRQINNKNINSFVLNPKSRGIIYFISGNQLFKTTDNGQTWQLIYTEGKPNITLSGLAISHFDTSYIYILTSDGTLLLSSDWGDSWQTVYNFKLKTNKLFISPYNSQLIFVVADREIFRSVDAGKNWQPLLAEQRENFPGIDQFRELQFGNQVNQLIYLSKYGILKSNNNGDTWQAITLITQANTVDINTFAINSKNPSEIYYIVGNILYHSVDNGRNWKTKLAPIPGGGKANQLLINDQNTDMLYLSIGQ